MESVHAVGASQVRNPQLIQIRSYLGLLMTCQAYSGKRERHFFIISFFFSSLFPYLYGAYQCKHIFLKEKASSSSFFQ